MVPPHILSVEKARLRALALACRAGMGEAARARASAEAATLALTQVPALADPGGGPIALFASFRDEIDTGPLARGLRARGARLALPVIQGRDLPLIFRRWDEGAELAPAGRFQIPTPGAEALEEVPEVVLVPLAAFDRRGLRIGYGGGFYDRTLERLRAGGRVLAVGFAFACQEVDEVPAAAHDAPVDLMVTEAEVFTCAGPPR